MPCDMMRDYSPGIDAANRAQQAERQATEATRAACDLALSLRAVFPDQWSEIEKRLSPATIGWIAQHDAEDKRRASR